LGECTASAIDIGLSYLSVDNQQKKEHLMKIGIIAFFQLTNADRIQPRKIRGREHQVFPYKISLSEARSA
jgi:hypothetical protein